VSTIKPLKRDTSWDLYLPQRRIAGNEKWLTYFVIMNLQRIIIACKNGILLQSLLRYRRRFGEPETGHKAASRALDRES